MVQERTKIKILSRAINNTLSQLSQRGSILVHTGRRWPLQKCLLCIRVEGEVERRRVMIASSRLLIEFSFFYLLYFGKGTLVRGTGPCRRVRDQNVFLTLQKESRELLSFPHPLANRKAKTEVLRGNVDKTT